MPALLHPDEPVPVRLMNTIWADRSSLHDDLATVDDLGAWLAAVGSEHEGSALGEADLAAFRALRDALRRLAAFVTDDTREKAASPTAAVDEAVAEVNRAIEAAPAWPRLEFRGGHLQASRAGGGSTAARSRSSVAAQAIGLLTGPGRDELRACYGPGCVLYFVKDHPRREWCSAGCGNRARAARHYARHKSEQSTTRD
ncbi:ABATE domain-containing protein [Glycomyces sp. YM15]|uniref:CGNR zinc finger domain-containing protein n=1 Tax=Glycomyces sp. YM15 TaxID=2800446 RepID=UPI0019633C84|nr:ABATE domain-containing protein [Glycomyces sp. YM15]